MIRALFVDDSATAGRLLQKQLGGVCELECVHDVPEALQRIVTAHYDLFLIDYRLEQGTGIELARTIRGMDLFRDTPILLLSHGMTEEVAFAAMRAGINQSLDKMVTPEELREVVLKQVAQPTIVEVHPERITTRCLCWKADNIYYEYSPQYGLRISAPTMKDAHRRMAEALQLAFEKDPQLEVLSEDVEVTSHILQARKE